MTVTPTQVNGWFQAVQFRDGPPAQVSSIVSLVNNGSMSEATAIRLSSPVRRRRLSDTEIEVKPTIGSIFLYPAGLIHRVNPVTKGARMGCAGWIQSRIRDAEKRQILFDLSQIHDILPGESANNPHKLHMVRTILQLERMWDEF